jgi:hypothetical protein
LIKQAGFEYQAFVGTTGFNSSPVTTGALFRANKKVQHDLVNLALDEL